MASEPELLAQIEELKAQLATAHTEQWKLIRHVCHELRLPLTTIKGYNDLMPLMGGLSDQQKDFVVRIKKNVARMSNMITNLHELAYMGEGQFIVKLGAAAPGEAIDKIGREMQPLAAERGNTLTASPSDTLPAVCADRERLEHILRILLENALMYTPSGGQVTITAALVENLIEFSVRDTGIGVAENERKSLFTLFFRGDVPLVREQVGAGMNLYMLRRFVEYMQGTYGVEFPPEGGSRFWVMLPIAH